MFSLFKKDPTKKLRKLRQQKLEEAMQAQRKGDMRLFASITNEAEALLVEIKQLEQEKV
ncbi:MAG TPA: Lacal_2735 family protein [Methylophaga aminisulfidivorans]|uniref:Lacal_2735 family protein n=2 Tax=root TaxID=1 RepID=A0A7C1VRV8_9GAMM|nr:Lacal_2735 family protein [Methylophaga aminisulfidivorans]HEC73961.1 Lacal_2735 family protein [Methylophaga aminisulfidivorans]